MVTSRPSGRFTINQAREGEMPIVRQLFTEYATWLNVDLAFQHFEQELANLPGAYRPPEGALLLARAPGDIVAGCVAVRSFEGTVCEMKRLWVRDEFRAQGLGSMLVRAIIDDARNAGYTRMVLDTLDTMTAARNLYARHGFAEIPPYYHNPLPGAVYLGRNL
jgi:ribosomal protein S18 acetylase RimI-like enzyme